MSLSLQKYEPLILAGALILTLSICGCLKDKIVPPIDKPLNESGELLFYLEENGDYINSLKMPSLAEVDEVYSNLLNYLLIDIRTPDEYSAGHIQNAINKIPAKIIDYLDSTDYKQYPKIILISKNGQSSAYYTCLLRLYGFENTFSMSYGMAAWNQTFSDEWFSALNTNSDLLQFYSDVNVPKPPFTPLPDQVISGSTPEEKVKNRIKDLMVINFEDKLIEGEGTATINYEWLMADAQNYVIVCYDSALFYKDLHDGILHPEGSISIHPAPYSELSSSAYLQSIPSNKKSAFYSTDGQLSAFVTAYLRLLGYDAKSVLFGANNMFYDILFYSPTFGNKAFSIEKIRNYPFTTGN